MKNPIHSTRLVFAGVGLLTLAGTTAQAAIAWNEYQFSGFFSQGYLYSTGNDYPTPDAGDGDFDFREYGANFTRRFGAHWRIGAQVFGQEFGAYGNDDLSLDWGIVDFNVRQEFGIRAGRVKMPRGLYNEALDLDMARAQILMPQSVYDVRLRDFNASFDGAMIYGNVAIGQLGSLDYRVFGGDIPMDVGTGASDYFNNDAPFPVLGIGMDSIHGGSLMWNTPFDGLRVGYSYSSFNNFMSDRLVVIPGVFEAEVRKTTDAHERHLFSLEYVVGSWSFAAEGGREESAYVLTNPMMAPSRLTFNSLYGYISAARRITPWLELGTYYSYSIDETVLHLADGPGTSTPPLPDLEQDDIALSARFDVHENVVLKLEGHYIKGAGKVFDTPAHPQPFPERDTDWMLFAAKATVFF